MNDENKLRRVPVKEAMRYARWGHSKLYELIQDGKIDAYRDGGRTLIDLNSIDRYQRTLQKIKPRRAS